MEIVRDAEHLEQYMANAVSVSGDSPVLIDQFLPEAVEVDVDALSDGKDVRIAGVMQHIELAGVHSGDSACSLPPHSLHPAVVREIESQTKTLANALDVLGLLNVQFAVQNGEVFLLEVNPRASRTVPFVAKATGIPVAAVAAKIMAGEPLESFKLDPFANGLCSVKEAVFPFGRFQGVDALLGPEMRSTGEVMGTDDSFGKAFLKAQIGAGVKLPRDGRVFMSFKNADKTADLVESARILADIGFEILATSGTAAYLKRGGIDCALAGKVHESRPNVIDLLKDGEISIVMNTADTALAVDDSHEIRSISVAEGIPYCTTAAAAKALAEALKSRTEGALEVRSLQSMRFP